MSGNKFYFDDPEGDGLAPETSHPNFVKHMTAEFYYDCTDDFSPFGNDDGADLLFNLEEWYQENNGKGSIVKWLYKIIDEFGFKYKSEDCSKLLDKPTLIQIEQEDPHFFRCMNNTIIGAAFGQYKISGQIDKELMELAKTAIKRQSLLNEDYDIDSVQEHNQYLEKMMDDLEKIE